ncbi:MAG: sce7726 family protein [Firmicutes bacterium]|nr:sce7726 family protein [Bacillota bacterium]
MKTRDRDVRQKLHEVLSREFLCDDDTIIIDELGLCQGEARIDIAVINGSLHGYEIKSDSDTLERLPRQVDIYNKVLDYITIVTGKNHIDKINDLVPSWWGIQQVEKVSKDKVNMQTIREPGINPEVDPYSLAQLLWKEEALELLTIFGMEKGYISKSRKVIWKR